MSIPILFFSYFALASIVLSLIVVTRKNYIHAVLWTLLLFIHISGIYLFLNAEFFAMIQMIVYAGAILVMLIFVIMLLNVRHEDHLSDLSSLSIPKIFFVFCVFGILALALQASYLNTIGKFSIDVVNTFSDAKLLGQVFYSEANLPLIIMGVVLFVPMIAAIVLAGKRSDE
ncbi:NADH-quinone oxidoreductase subunit J [Thermodesulfobium sp. 4217-1]|uniref:NADH-quinone oxidoreductase subunit J family protein n=1 Tax=Thermodesulfobium sp. 4217-1 TaxID=3120013 RepID=UPI003221EECF